MRDLMCFGLNAQEDTFAELSATNPLIFRIHFAGTDFVASAFRDCDRSTIPVAAVVDRKAIVRHICEWTPEGTPWMSCTFSLPYVLWEAHRRINESTIPETVIAELCVSIIDAKHPLLQPRAILAVEALRDVHGNAVNFARAFQEVLVYGQIPSETLIATTPWTVLRTVFERTHMDSLAITSYEDKPFANYCHRLRRTLRRGDASSAMICAAEQATQVLGTSLYTQVQSEQQLQMQIQRVVDFARCIFAWPYRHSSYKLYQTSPESSSMDLIFPQLQQELFGHVTQHSLCRRASLELQLSSLQSAIDIFRKAHSLPLVRPESVTVGNIPAEVSCGSSQSATSLLSEALLSTLSAIGKHEA